MNVRYSFSSFFFLFVSLFCVFLLFTFYSFRLLCLFPSANAVISSSFCTTSLLKLKNKISWYYLYIYIYTYFILCLFSFLLRFFFPFFFLFFCLVLLSFSKTENYIVWNVYLTAIWIFPNASYGVALRLQMVFSVWNCEIWSIFSFSKRGQHFF